MKILTEHGFKNFGGILEQGLPECLIKISFSDDTHIKATPDHRFLIDDSWINCDLLDIGDFISEKEIISIDEVVPEEVYDMFEVEDTHSYYSNGVISHNCNFLYIDEAAIIPNNIAEEFFASTYPTISSGQTTKILITSTPLGYNHFWKFWNEAEKGKNGFIPLQINYWDIPGRDEKWAEEQLKILGEVKFNQEVLTQFLGSSHTLINGRTLGLLSSQEPVFKSDSGDLQIYKEPEKGRTYVITVDTSRGIGGDYSAATIIDVTDTPYELVGKYRNNTISPSLLPNVIFRLAKDYNEAFVLVETNDIGGQVADILHQDLEYDNILTTISENKKTILSAGFSKTTTLGVRTSQTVKRQGCFAIKSLIEESKLLIFDADIISELSTFIEHNNTFKADEGYFDDLVMTLVLFGWLTTNTYFKDLTDIDVRIRMFEQQMQQIEEDLTPFGFITSSNEEEYEVEDNIVWSTDGRLPWLRDL